MGVLGSLLLREDDATVYECRHCGTTVEGQDAACPYCGVSDVVRYDFS